MKQRPYPVNTLGESLGVAEKIQELRAGKGGLKKILLAEGLGIKPTSSRFRELLSSSYRYGLTLGTEKAKEITLTPLGEAATQAKDAERRLKALREAAMKVRVFREFYEGYDDKKVPSAEMLKKVLQSEFSVPPERAEECAKFIVDNGVFSGLIRESQGSQYVMLDGATGGEEVEEPEDEEEEQGEESETESAELEQTAVRVPTKTAPAPRAIFIGHGKKRGPMEKITKILGEFKIPYRVVVDEANLGRPIPVKVRETMLECNSAILIFSCDQKFQDAEGHDVWRPSENVVYELGAASFAYQDKVVIFKEKGITLPTNFESVGRIEFEEDVIEAKTMDLLKELVGFGLLKVTPVE